MSTAGSVERFRVGDVNPFSSLKFIALAERDLGGLDGGGGVCLPDAAPKLASWTMGGREGGVDDGDSPHGEYPWLGAGERLRGVGGAMIPWSLRRPPGRRLTIGVSTVLTSDAPMSLRRGDDCWAACVKSTVLPIGEGGADVSAVSCHGVVQAYQRTE